MATNPKGLLRGSRGVVTGIVLGAAFTMISVAAATTTPSPKVFYGCLKQGLISSISFAPHACSSGTSVQWNQAGVPGPSNVASLAGTPCTFDGKPSTIALTQSATTGAVSVTCKPVPLSFGGTATGGTMTEINLVDNATDAKMCNLAASCNANFTAGHNLQVQFLSGRLDTGGGSPYSVVCPAGWTGSGPATAAAGFVSGTYYAATCLGTSVTASTTAKATFTTFSAAVTGGTMGEINLTENSAEAKMCLSATSCSSSFVSGDNLEVVFLSGRLDIGGGSPFTATCPSGWTGSGAATATPGSITGTYYTASCKGTAVTTSTTSKAAF